MYAIRWEVDGSSGETHCAGILVDATMIDLIRAGYIVLAIVRIE